MCSSVQVSSVAQSCLTLCNSVNRGTPGLPVHHQFLEFTQTHVHGVGDPSNHLILCCPLLLSSSIFPSIRVFSNESALCIRWPNVHSSVIYKPPRFGSKLRVHQQMNVQRRYGIYSKEYYSTIKRNKNMRFAAT